MTRTLAADVFSVARYVRQRLGQVDPRKLQKLVYYVQAWSLVWRQRPAFGDRIEAWVDGPVSPDLWTDGIQHTGRVQSAGDLSQEDRAHVDRVLGAYGAMSTRELIDLSHDERPWREARGLLPASARSQVEISQIAMATYYAERWRDAEADRETIDRPTFSGSPDEIDAALSR
jgi:uncharacterized phage-associated protein